jgi:hypothetical protein
LDAAEDTMGEPLRDIPVSVEARQQPAAELAIDRQSLVRFVNWIADHPQHEFSILFTSWREASWYQQTLTHLFHLSNVCKVAI